MFPRRNCVQLEKAHFGQSPGTCVYADLLSLRDAWDWTEPQSQHPEDWAVLQDTAPQPPSCFIWTSCHPLAAFQLGKMGVSHLCWGRQSLFTHLCSCPRKTSQGEL